jgi:hypothetical protein
MEPILIDDRFDLGEFSDLMDQGFGIVTGEPMTASATSGRLAVERLVDPLGRDQGAVGLAMPTLPAALLATRRGGGLALQADRIGRGGLGRVGGVELESSLEVMDSGFQLRDPRLMDLEQGQDRHLEFGRGAVPEMIGERRRGCHYSKIVS